jgi:hypothetical protein
MIVLVRRYPRPRWAVTPMKKYQCHVGLGYIYPGLNWKQWVMGL